MGNVRVLCLLILTVIILFSATYPLPTVHAAGVVGSGTPTSCSEAALDSALAHGGVITFNCGAEPHTLILSSTKTIPTTTPVTIDGGGLITISGNDAVRVFEVGNGGNLTLTNLAIIGGKVADGRGGALLSVGSTVNIHSSHISNNSATYGGALAALEQSSITIDNTTISASTASESGGGIHIRESSATIRNSVIKENSALSEHGGGIAFIKGGSLTVQNSTIASNITNQLGGGIFASGSGTLSLLNIHTSTITGNHANQGGALYGSDTATIVASTTIAANTVTTSFGGIEYRGSASSLTLRNTILSNPPVETIEWDDPNCAIRDGATLINEGGNIQFPRDSCGAEIVTADPLLLPLADHDGTLTMALGAGSPAIDMGTNECPIADQRGVARPVDGDSDGTAACDSGAYEVQATDEQDSADNIVGNGAAGSCTEEALRKAVLRGGSITFACGNEPHTITVSDDIIITEDTILDGGGPQQGGNITISGGDTTRVFFINNTVDLTVQNLTIADGKEPGDDSAGGGIYGGDRNNITIINTILRDHDGTASHLEHCGGALFTGNFSTVLISDTLFLRNRGINGGAINNLLSVLTVVDTSFVENEAIGGTMTDMHPDERHGGGAIYTDGVDAFHQDPSRGGTITIRGTSFLSNTAYGQGGAYFSSVYDGDNVVIEDSLFMGNIALIEHDGHGALGGGLYHYQGPLQITSTTFANNLARRQGGGFWPNGRDSSTLVNVTFTGNQAVTDVAAGTGGLGGAMAGGGNTMCINCTIADNHAGEKGGAVFFNKASYPGKEITLVNTIIAHNTAFNDGSGSNIYQNCADDILTDGGGNIQLPGKNPQSDKDIDCVAGATIADPMLDEWSMDSTTLPIVALQPGSPAIDAADDAQCPATDRRGALRPADGDGDGVARCDIGAYEYNAVVPDNIDGDDSTATSVYLPLIGR